MAYYTPQPTTMPPIPAIKPQLQRAQPPRQPGISPGVAALMRQGGHSYDNIGISPATLRAAASGGAAPVQPIRQIRPMQHLQNAQQAQAKPMIAPQQAKPGIVQPPSDDRFRARMTAFGPYGIR